MTLPESLYEELDVLAKQYTAAQPKLLNKLNVQDLVRLIVKSHMQALRGQTRIEELRLRSFDAVSFLVGACPNCLLRVDKQDFPVLIQTSEGWECHVCGSREHMRR